MMPLSALRDPFFIYRHRQWIHVIRSSVALALLLAAYYVLRIPHGSWAMVSALMVMGSLPHIGGVVAKGLQRLAGTTLGAIYGVLILILTSHILIGYVATLIGIGFALYASFKNRYGYSALMFGITLLMVVGDNDPDVSIGIWRAFNVIVGTTVAILVTALVLPQRATDMLRFLMADNIDQINRLYHADITEAQLDSKVRLGLIRRLSAQHTRQNGLVEAVHQERRINRASLREMLLTEQRMISTVELLLETRWETRSGHELIDSLEGLNSEQHTLVEKLDELAHQLRTGQMITVEIDRFQLQRYAEMVFNKSSKKDHWVFSPTGYLMLNQELAREASSLIDMLKAIQYLPSNQLRKRAHRAHLVADRLEFKRSKQAKKVRTDDKNP